MVEIQNTPTETSDKEYYQKELDKISDKEASNDINFSNTLTAFLNITKGTPEILFNSIISRKINIEVFKKTEKDAILRITEEYIQNKSNKENVLNKYLQHFVSIPKWISRSIESTYSPEEIWEYELQSYFKKHDIISIGKEICGENWDGSNMDKNNPEISNTCPWCFFTLEQFIWEFNKKNNERINNNLNNLDGLDLMELFCDISKIWWKLYLNGEEITDKSFEDPKIYNRIYQKLWAGNFANVNEFQKLISTEINKWINLLLENTEDENDKKENKESSNLINSIESMELENIWELTDGDAVQIENVNHIFDISKKFFIKRIQSGESQITNPNTIKKQIAYILGTAKWECRFKNVKQKWSKNKYCGRWFVQLTYGYNYKKFGDIARDSGFTFKDNNWNILSEDDLDLYNHPDNLLKSNELAAFILVHWSINWLFTWKKLDDYINDNSTNFLWARKIIWWKYPSKYVNTANICLSHINIW